ncbi:hypothetical protein [Rhodopirellula baltica]|nr:hypothetical protein [Rhodopirellula baltica]EGF24479.1 glycosyltransferase [Rhodopirellula baltica WH47]ELP32139.1 hypothetical protein RBSWK_03838 [Rhodopirellula baltica SWK14]HBE64388.1 glycosyltransferase [Rhodopirellula baltica]
MDGEIIMATVVCTRWLDAFPASYVTVLRNAVAANLNRPHRFVCVTDNVAGLTDGVEGVQMPDLGIPMQRQQKGCWPKLSILAPGVLPADEPTLYLDLDVMVNQNLDGFFDRLEAERGFHALREWNPTLWNLAPLKMRPDRGVQGSILGFFPGEQAQLFHRFNENQQECFERFPLDQDFLTENVEDVRYWPYEWTASFKWHCLKYYPFNQLFPEIKRPAKAKVVVFHGNPRPIDVVPQGDYYWGTKRKFGRGPVDWVRAYWLRHDASWAENLWWRKSSHQHQAESQAA